MKAFLSRILVTAVLLKRSINAADIADTNDIDLELRLGLPESSQTQLPADGKANKQANKREADRIRKKNFRKRMKESEPDVLTEYRKKEQDYAKKSRSKRKQDPEAYSAYLQKQREYRLNKKIKVDQDPIAKQEARIRKRRWNMASAQKRKLKRQQNAIAKKSGLKK